MPSTRATAAICCQQSGQRAAQQSVLAAPVGVNMPIVNSCSVSSVDASRFHAVSRSALYPAKYSLLGKVATLLTFCV
eukprot:5329760-Lingulodinium_polyedra.AAC.1